MIKKCTYCRTDNSKEANYCRKCGLPFEPKEPTSKDLDLIRQLTSRWKKYSQWKRPITGYVVRLTILAVLSLSAAAFYSLFAREYISNEKFFLFLSTIIVLLIFLIIGLCIANKQLPSLKEKNAFNSIYEKIEPYCYLGIQHSRKRHLYKIFLRQGKMGLMDVSNYKVALDPHFSSMKWKKKQAVLTVTLNGDTFDITTNGEFC